MAIQPFYFFTTDFSKKLDFQREFIFKMQTLHGDKIKSHKDLTRRHSLSDRINDYKKIYQAVQNRMNKYIQEGALKVKYNGDPFKDTFTSIEGPLVGLNSVLDYGNKIASDIKKII